MPDTENTTVVTNAVDVKTIVETALSVGMSHTEVLQKVSSLYTLYTNLVKKFSTCKDGKALALAALIYACQLATAAGITDRIKAKLVFLHNAVVGVAKTYTASFWSKFGSWFRSIYNVLCTGASALNKIAEEAGATAVESTEDK